MHGINPNSFYIKEIHVMRNILSRGCLAIAILALSGMGAAAMCTKAATVNLRAGPGTNYPKSWVVYQFMPLKKVGEKGDWLKVQDVDGQEHWVLSDLVTDDFDCAVVARDKINMRSGPGTQFAKSPISPLTKYYAFEVVETEGDWVKVRDEVKNEGWISKNLLWIQ
jgi:SH3-like domain-containing protein